MWGVAPPILSPLGRLALLDLAVSCFLREYETTFDETAIIPSKFYILSGNLINAQWCLQVLEHQSFDRFVG